jgi:predicted ArsR family transcriptional regulator
MSGLHTRIGQLSALAEPVRRALYAFVVAQREPVTREQAAAGVDVPLHVAKFHLDRLVEEGLLDAEYRRPPGRGGPGAGRPAKVYRRSDLEVEVSLPERRYDVAGRVLVRAVAHAERAGVPVAEAIEHVAVDAGREVGADAARRVKRRSTTKTVVDTLVHEGYEPYVERDGIRLANCPFDALARDETELVCGMNLCYLEGVLEGIGAEGLSAELEPTPGQCCVHLRKV